MAGRVGATIENFITNPNQKQREPVMDLLPQYLKIIRGNVYPENEERLKAAEKRFQTLNN